MAAISAFRRQYGDLVSKYDLLWTTVDPDAEPYKSKYEARALLEPVVLALNDAVRQSNEDTNSSTLRDVLAMLHVRLGVNYIQTEENQTGEGHLLLALSWLAQRFSIARRQVAFTSVSVVTESALRSGGPTSAAEATAGPEGEKKDDEGGHPRPAGPITLLEYVQLASSALEACNYLSLVYSGWDNHARALRFLRVAKAVYRRVRAMQAAHATAIATGATDSGVPGLLMSVLPDAGPVDSGTAFEDRTPQALASALLTLDSLFTHTIFYYAQVYGHLGCTIIAAAYVERTLCRQLAEQRVAAGRQAASAATADSTADAAGTADRSAGPDWLYGISAASLDRQEWAKNALRLGAVHVTRHNWSTAGLCFAAAETMLGTLVAERTRAAAAESAAQAASTSSVSSSGGVTETVIDKVSPDALAAAAGPVEVSSLLKDNGSNTNKGEAQADQPNKAEKAIVRTTKPADAWRSYPEPLQRLLAEVCGQWAGLYAAMLSDARLRYLAAQGDCEPPIAPRASDFDPLPPEAASADAGGDDGPDPFDTGPTIRFSARVRSSGRLRGEGIDTIDAGDSDHEGDTGMLAAGPGTAGRDGAAGGGALAVAHLRASPSAVAEGGSTAEDGGHTMDLASFVATVGPSVTSHIVSYGPGNLLHPSTGQSIPVLGRMTLSGLPRLPQLEDTVPTFETARDIFKAGLVSSTRALAFFVVDGYVTDHVGLTHQLASMYGHLADFEEDHTRASAMQTRRGAALYPLLQSLSSTVYLNYHTELAIDAAAGYRSAFEHRLLAGLVKGKGAPMDPKDVAAIRDAAGQALACFVHFLRCFSDPRLPVTTTPVLPDNGPSPPLPGAAPLEDDNTAHAYMSTHYAIARILYRMPFTGDVPRRLAELTCALRRMQWIVAHVGDLGHSGYFSSEVDTLRAMIQLTEQRVQLLRATGRDVAVD